MPTPSQNNILAQFEPSILLAIHSLQESKKTANNLGPVKNALRSARECAEAMATYLVLETFHNGQNILDGVDNGYTIGSSTSNKSIVLHSIIEVLYQQCRFDPVSYPAYQLHLC